MSQQKNRTPGKSTQMPTVSLPLGKYVVLKRRANGTHRAIFQVPARLRPPKWQAAITLPLKGPRPGTMLGDEVAAIQRDAAILYADMMQIKTGSPVKPPERSLSTLIGSWRRTSKWKELKKRSRDNYEDAIKVVLKWSANQGHPDPTIITQADIEDFLSIWDDRPRTKQEMLKVIRLVMKEAIANGWRIDNPASGISVKVTPKKAVIWEQEDVNLYVDVAREQGMESIALIILLEWEIGQRLADIRAMKPGSHYNQARGVFSFDQSKTGNPVDIQISAKLQAMLEPVVSNDMFLFKNERTGKAYEEKRLSKTFAWVRKAVVDGDKDKGRAPGRYLLLRHLRHSCVVQLARAGCTVPEICSITGHALGSAETILGTYLVRDTSVARGAQMKRGLI